MEQSQKDANVKVAWITGGLALVGTVLTLIFNDPGPGTEDSPPSPASTTISPTTTPPTSPMPVPPEVMGIWSGGAMGQINQHLSITASADYICWDDNVPGSRAVAKSLSRGQFSNSMATTAISTGSLGPLRRRRKETFCTWVKGVTFASEHGRRFPVFRNPVSLARTLNVRGYGLPWDDTQVRSARTLCGPMRSRCSKDWP